MKKNKIQPIQIYLGKYPPLQDDNITDEEKVIKYFDCLFGDKMSLVKVASYENIKDFCNYNGYTKEFVLKTIKNHLDDWKFKT